MKLLLITLFVAAATASPIPDDSGPVDVIVNGVPEGHALDLGGIIDVKVQEHVEGQVVAVNNVLHPFTAEGIAEAVAAAAAENSPIEVPAPAEATPEEVLLPETVIIPEAIVLPEAAEPEAIPQPIVLPEAADPEVILQPVVLPEPAAPEVILQPIVLPEPASPEVIPEPILLPEPASPEVIVPAPIVPIIPEPVIVEETAVPEVVAEEPVLAAPQLGEIFNDGTVQVTVNAPSEPGFTSYLSSWFNMVLNYISSSGAQTSSQIV